MVILTTACSPVPGERLLVTSGFTDQIFVLDARTGRVTDSLSQTVVLVSATSLTLSPSLQTDPISMRPCHMANHLFGNTNQTDCVWSAG